ncbi:MAG TPA: hypothetical protein DEO70_13245 [Bacteroidales bacterium]|nr:MAG: hypothetical protein A2X11_06025 [Bacteroidetes bacterium GWE2_42_24]OFY31338.1 MAG: hypothetical protein A2X09_01105 [Bacteroidetes bacterium GWF2_43_11]HBZ67793.1 hypothetical protein [Bacteroidales bacterium]
MHGTLTHFHTFAFMIVRSTSQLIAIAGVSRAGKTSLAMFIQQTLPDIPVRIFHLDNFVYPEEQIPKINGHTDWECPKSTNFDALFHQVKPHLTRPGITIIEGLFPFSDPRLAPIYNKVLYLSLPFREFYQRKVKDVRWGAEPSWYIRHIWRSHLKYGSPPKEYDGQSLFLPWYDSSQNSRIVEFVRDF